MDKKVNVAVLVSGGGTNLQALIDYEKAGKLKSGKIVKVISSRDDAYALTRAKNANIEGVVVKRKGVPFDVFEQGIIDELEKCSAQVIVLAGFMSILSKKLISRYPNRIINVHPSLIPSFCGDGFYGLKVHEQALAYGVKVTGATVHYVNEITDGGKIIMQKSVAIKDGDTPEVLQKRVMEQAEWILLPQAVENVSKKIAEEK